MPTTTSDRFPQPTGLSSNSPSHPHPPPHANNQELSMTIDNTTDDIAIYQPVDFVAVHVSPHSTCSRIRELHLHRPHIRRLNPHHTTAPITAVSIYTASHLTASIYTVPTTTPLPPYPPSPSPPPAISTAPIYSALTTTPPHPSPSSPSPPPAISTRPSTTLSIYNTPWRHSFTALLMELS